MGNPSLDLMEVSAGQNNSAQQAAHFSGPPSRSSGRLLSDRFEGGFESDDGFRMDLADS